MPTMKVRKVFTTGQVANLRDLAPRTASKWFDSGKLAGYRIPLSNDRRVPRENLIRFKENGMPLGELEDEGIAKVLLVGAGEAITARLAELLPAADGFRIAAAADGFDAGLLVPGLAPDAVVIDLCLGRGEGTLIAGKIRKAAGDRPVVVIALAGEDEPDPAWLLARGFDDVFKHPFDAAVLAERIRPVAAETAGAA